MLSGMAAVPNPRADLNACIVDCLECYSLCRPHSSHPHAGAILADCAEICRTAADFMLRGSPHHPAICAVCADVCDACADACEAIEGLQAVARACRGCADSCRQHA